MVFVDTTELITSDPIVEGGSQGGVEIVKVEIPAEGAGGAISVVEEYQAVEAIQVVAAEGTTTEDGTATHHVIATPTKIYYQQIE